MSLHWRIPNCLPKQGDGNSDQDDLGQEDLGKYWMDRGMHEQEIAATTGLSFIYSTRVNGGKCENSGLRQG